MPSHRKKLAKARAAQLGRTIAALNAHPDGGERVLAQASYLVATFFMVLLLVLFSEVLKPLCAVVSDRWVMPWIRTHPLNAFVVACAAALLLYVLRTVHRYYYGFVELAFAVAALYFIARTLPQDGAMALVGLAGAMYVLVRALDNMGTGFASPRVVGPAAAQGGIDPDASPDAPGVQAPALEAAAPSAASVPLQVNEDSHVHH